MGTGLVGEVQLENGERVFVTWIVRPMEEPTRRHITRLRTAQLFDANGKSMEKLGMLAFGMEPNPDAADGTFIGTFLDVTRKR